MIKGSLFGDYQMEIFGTLGSTLKLCHHLPSTYWLYIYIWRERERFYRVFRGILREQLVRVLLPTCSLGDYHERRHPTPYHFFVMLQKQYNPSSHFGENMFAFSLWISVFFPVFFVTVCFKNSNPLKKPGQRCDCFNHHLLKLFLAEPQVSHLVECKGKSFNLPSFWGEVTRWFLPWIHRKPCLFFV